MNSAGSAMKENERYLDSIQGKIDQFTNSLQTFWMNAISSDFVKGIVDIGTTLLNLLDKITNKIKIFGDVAAVVIGKNFAKWLMDKNGIKGFSGLFDKLLDVTKIKESFNVFKNSYSEVINMASKTKGLDVLAELANYDDAAIQLGVLKDLLNIKDENTTVSKAFVKSILEEHAAELGLNAETVQAILNSELFAASQTGAAVGTDILTAAQTRLIAVLQGVKAAFMALYAAHPVLLVIAGIAAAIGLVYAAYKKWGPTHDNYIKKLEEESKNLKEIQENLKDLNSELETTKQRIEELENKGPLTLTEQEELDKLRAQNAELERQIKLEEAREERARNKQAQYAASAFKTDSDFQVQIDPYTGMEIGNTFEQKLKALQTAKDNLTKAEIDLQSAYDSGIEKNIKKAEKKLNKAQEAYTNAQSSWDTLIKNNEEEYGDLEWFDGDNLTEAQKKVNEIISTIQNYNDRAEILFGSAGAKESALNRLFGERGSEAGQAFNEAFKAKIESGELKVDAMAFDNTSLEEAKEYYDEVMSEVEQKGIDITKTMYGNIDMNNRQVLYWTQENLDKYKDAIESWGETIDSMGDYSTVFGSSENFDGIEIAFTPMLQTENGAIFLDKNTVYKYIYGLIDKAKENGEEPTLDVLLQLDKEGLGFNGQQIKNMIADVGETAIKTGEAMHYVGDTGAVENAKKALDEAGGSFEDVVKSAEDMINASPQLKLQLDSLGLSAEDVARYFLDIDEAMQQTSETTSTIATDMASLNSAYESYASALQIANEVAFDGQAISEDYYESLKEYLGDVTVGEEDFSDAIDVNNGKVVKNTKLLKNLITQKKKEQKATVSAAKAQSQLQYTKVVKNLQQVVKGMASEYKAYGYVTQATYQNISALREQISNIKNAIKEYSLLELKLSDVTNAYTEFENAKNRDAELTYGDSLIEGIQALNDGFATGKVGTETFKAAVDLIVPPEAYEGLDDYQDRLVAIHDYVDKNPLFADWFTVDEDGNFGIEFKNMAAFVQDMQNMGVFTGDDITGFNFGDGVKSIEDIVTKTKEWNDGVGATKETIVAMLTELSKYDARWGDLVEELTMTDVDKAFKNTTEALDAAIAKQEQFFKAKKDPNGEGASEYAAIQQEINNCSDALANAQQNIINNTNAWVEASKKVDTAKEKVSGLTRDLQQLEDNETNSVEIQIKTNQLNEAKKELSDALQIKYGLEEPTQMDFQVSFESIQAQIDKWDEEHATLAVKVVPKLEQDSNGVWKIPAEVQADLSEEDLKALQERLKLTNEETTFANLINTEDGIDPVVSELTNITDILSSIYNVISGGKTLPDSSGSSDAVKGLDLRGNTTTVKAPKTTETKKEETETTTSTTPGFDSEAIDQKIAAANAILEEWWQGIVDSANEMGESLSRFFTETLPTKWNEFWSVVGEKLSEFGAWAQELGASIGKFFTETLPQKWDEFWTWVGQEFNNFKSWADQLGQDIAKFFTDTLPQKWDEFWDAVGNFFMTDIPYAIGYFSQEIKEFFTQTLPNAWNNLWSNVSNYFNTSILPALNSIKTNIVQFFTQTIPTAWNNFWNSVGNYINTTLVPALQATWSTIVQFFTTTIPTMWTNFWNSVQTFITQTVPTALTSTWNTIVQFFTVTVPTAWTNFWNSVSNYISTNITPALSSIWNTIVQFFTSTIPTAWSNFWNSVQTFITQTIPNALTTLKQGVTAFFTVTLPQAISGLWNDLTTWVKTEISNFWTNLKSGIGTIVGNFKKGWSDSENNKEFGATKAKGNALAKGNAYAQDKPGLKTNEHNTVVGELGRELVCDVDKGVYYTVGDNGTEMVNLPKHAIIYNHKQTEELLKNGQTSRGTLLGGLSFATGNAHAYYSDGYRHGLFGGYLSDDPVFKDTSKQWVDANQNWVDDFANAADGISDAADSLSDSADEFEDTINWIEILFTRIDNVLAEHEAYLATIVDSTGGLAEKNSIYNTIFGKLYDKASYSVQAANYYQQLADSILSGMDQVIASKVRNGTILIEEITDEALKENIDKALDYLDQVSQYKQQYYSTLEEIADKALERQEEVAKAYENEIGLVEHLNNALEARNDLEEKRNGFATEAYYKAQISASEKRLEMLKQERDALQAVFDMEVALGRIPVGSQQWFDMQNAIYDCDDAIIDMEISIEDLQNAINDLYWDRFDELINRFGYLEDEISNVIELLSHDPDGLVMEELRDLTTTNWATGSGLASLGLYAQQMEEAQYVANQYAEQIKELKKQYAAGRYNETEYLNKLNELISAQYENIEKYYDAKDAIIELNQTRVDAIKDGIQKEIDAYDELIQKKKELLNRERDLHDFQDEVAEKEKDVSDLRKQLAAMAGDTTAATTAKRKQLEAQLVEAQKALEDSYYSHSMSSRQEALDKEFSDFEEEKNAEIDKWSEYAENVDQVVSDCLDYVKANTSEVYSTLSDLGQEYNLTLSDNLITPWQNGSNAIDSYSENFGTAVSNFTQMLDDIVDHWAEVTAAAEEAAKAQAAALQAEYKKTTSNLPSTIGNSSSTSKPPVSTATKNYGSNVTKPTTTTKTATKAITTGSKVNAGSARIYADSYGGGGGRQYFASNPIYTVLQERNGYLLVRHVSLSSGYTGWFKKSDVKAYAKGTLGTKKNELALIDELGEELVLNADGSGKLRYLTKGSSVIPADITEKIMNIVTDPTSIFDGIKTNIKVPNIETKDFNFEFNFDSLLHVDNASNDSIPALKKMIRSEFSNMMSSVNQKLKRV